MSASQKCSKTVTSTPVHLSQHLSLCAPSRWPDGLCPVPAPPVPAIILIHIFSIPLPPILRLLCIATLKEKWIKLEEKRAYEFQSGRQQEWQVKQRGLTVQQGPLERLAHSALAPLPHFHLGLVLPPRILIRGVLGHGHLFKFPALSGYDMVKQNLR